ncbi:hypothetical protein [Paraburkholderia sp. DHOC27]|uniref:hypothetical protein n=1 Tax=Paraburkholderia sp. DHOC27 TaxID=2303330 RepID=UPI000E3C40A3|nr:hypothetical protein [Paraburkholderia sp. DHOC27]RFU45398.1 hypothetical protein D0B32_22550 [Paraburkholderia sp. DHOC27]
MNTLFRSTLLAAAIVLPTAAFAQSVAPVAQNQTDQTQVVLIAYDADVHTHAANEPVTKHASTPSDTSFNPAADVGLKSIYLRH